MVDPARVLVDPDTVSEDDLRQMLAPHSLETVRWVVASTKQTLDGLQTVVFNDLSLYNGLDAHPVLVHLGAETVRMQQQAQGLLGEVENALKANPAAATATAAADADAEAPGAYGAIKQRAAGLVRGAGSLVRRTERALRSASQEAVERAKHESVRIIHNLADVGGHALRLVASSRARQAMKVVVFVAAAGTLMTQFIPALFGMEGVTEGFSAVVSMLGATQELLPERGTTDADSPSAESKPEPSRQPPSQFIIDLRELTELHSDGGLSDEEFTRFKQKIWESEPCP